jgi:hypothetical protein
MVFACKKESKVSIINRLLIQAMKQGHEDINNELRKHRITRRLVSRMISS